MSRRRLLTLLKEEEMKPKLIAEYLYNVNGSKTYLYCDDFSVFDTITSKLVTGYQDYQRLCQLANYYDITFIYDNFVTSGPTLKSESLNAGSGYQPALGFGIAPGSSSGGYTSYFYFKGDPKHSSYGIRRAFTGSKYDV